MDVEQQLPDLWLKRNPLARVQFDEQFHDLVSLHLGRSHFSPFTSGSVRSHEAEVFYTWFFIGLLTSVKSKNSEIHSVYQRKTPNVLQLAVLYGEHAGTLYIHDINFGRSQSEVEDEIFKPMNKRQLAAINKEIESLIRSQLLDEFTIEETEVYRYRMVEQPTDVRGDHVGFQMELKHDYSCKAEKMPTDYEESDIAAAREYTPLLIPMEVNERSIMRHFEKSLEEFSDVVGEPDMNKLAELATDALTVLLEFRTNRAEKPLETSNYLARRAGFLHGTLFTVLPDEYYERIMSADLPAVHYNGDSAFLYFTAPSEISHEHALVDVDSKRLNIHRGYELVEQLKHKDRRATLKEIRYTTKKEIEHRTLDWNLHNIVQNLHLDAREAVESEARQFKVNYDHSIQLIREMITDQKFGNTIKSLSSLKAFLLGRLKTDPTIRAKIGLINADMTVNHFRIPLNLHFGYSISFNPDQVDSRLEDLIDIFKHYEIKGNKLCINFRFENGQVHIQATTLNEPELPIKQYIVPLGFENLRATLEKITNSDATSISDGDAAAVKYKFHNQLQSVLLETKTGYLPQNTEDAYLAGVLSNVGLTQFDVQENDNAMSAHSQLELVDKKITLNWKMLKEYYTEPATAAIQNFRNEQHRFTIAFNFLGEDSELAVAASSSNQVYLNTDNVHALCPPTLRRKRNPVPYCRLYSKEQNEEKEEKVNYEDIEEGVEEKYPSLSEHVTILHEVSGKLQLGFIARDMIGQLYQNDLQGFERSAFFFGATTISANIGGSIAAVGKSAKKAGKRMVGGILETTGGCFAMLGFDVYMKYQLDEEIKRNDTTSAIYTRAYIGLDLAECALTAIAAFGVGPFIPEIIGVISVFRLLAMVAQNVQETKHKIEELETILPLTSHEIVYETLREFLHLGTDEVIVSMVNEVTANEAAVKHTFQKYADFNRFLISAAYKIDDGRLIFIDDNTIDLTKTYQFDKSRLMPRGDIIGANVTTFCSLNEAHNADKKELEKSVAFSDTVVRHVSQGASGTGELRLPRPKPYNNPTDDYYCENAFGATNVKKTVPSKTLYLLFNGTDNVVAFPTVRNVFILMNGNKSITGGVQADVFAIQAEYIFGYLNGSDGEDTADFSPSDAGKDLVIRNGETFFSPMHGNDHTLKLYNIETVIGRSGLNDYIEVCDEKKIDLGGSTYGMDRINITNNCPGKKKNLTIILRKNTFVTCDAEDSLIRYVVADKSETDLVLKAGKHEIQINSVGYADLTMKADKYFRVMKFANSSIMRLRTADISNVSFLFMKENLTMKIDNENNITLYLHGANSIFDIIEKYAENIEQNLHVKLIANSEGGKIVLSHNLLTTEFDGRNRILNLVSNGHHNDMQLLGHRSVDNYFLISVHFKKLKKLFNIVIHPHLSNVSHCYIDLHNLTREIQEATNGAYGLFVQSKKQAEHIIVKVFAYSNTAKMDQMVGIGQINITNSYKFMDQITVYLYGKNKFSDLMNDVWLKPHPIHVNKTFLTILPGQFEFASEINFNCSAFNLAAYNMNGSLIVTNIVTMEETSHRQPITIVLSEYFVYQAKYNTLALIFNNERLDVPALLEDVRDIRLMWMGIKEALDEAKKSSITVE